MRRHLPLITILVCQVLLAALVAFLYLVTRPAFAEVYRDFPGQMPRLAALSLSSWYLPSLPVVAVVLDGIGLLMPKRSARNFALGLGLVIPAFGLTLAAFGIFVPLFQVAPMP